MTTVLLEDRSVVAVSGPEARSFLQGLITNDVEKLAPAHPLYAALLTPQGKVLFDFLLAEGDGALLIDCARSGRDALIKRLSMYKLRAKVTIEPREQLSVLVGLSGRPAARGITFEDPRLPGLGHRSIGAAAEMPQAEASAATYHAHRLALGVPEGGDFGSDRIFALDAGLDELHAVDFEKGCYVGQELTARMKHRGTARKRLLVVDGDADLAQGVELRSGGHSIGEVVSTYGRRGFALVRLDRLDEARDIEAGSVRVTVTKQNWL
jgi:tRNA-modifying protein YgfZ